MEINKLIDRLNNELDNELKYIIYIMNTRADCLMLTLFGFCEDVQLTSKNYFE